MSDRDWPDIRPRPKPQPNPEPTPTPTPEPNPEPEPTPTPTPEPTPAPTPEPTPTPTPKPARTIGAPKGLIPLDLKIAFGRGGAWAEVNRDDPFFVKYGERYGVDPEMLKAMQVIESGGQMIWNLGGSGAFGTMQIKEAFWGAEAKRLGFNLKEREGQVGFAAAFLGGAVRDVRGSTPRERFLYGYYPVLDAQGNICLTCRGEDNHTPQEYLDDMDRLIGIIKKAAGGDVVTPVPLPAHPYEFMFGYIPAYPFGFRDEGGIGYPYGVGHGTDHEGQHTGDDIKVPYGTRFKSPGDGKVLCVGGSGQGMWGQVCGFFNDTGDAGPGSATQGVGNITVLFDTGHKVVFGHSRTCNFKPGDRVKRGDWLGTTGGMLGPHMHLEVAVERGGTYWLIDPVPALRVVMGNAGGGGATPTLSGIIWEGTSNFESRAGIVPAAVVVHVTDDMNFSNVKSWFQQKGSGASAHWVIPRDGTKHQFVGSKDAAWTNGDVKNPRRDIDWLRRVVDAGGRMNRYTITIENVGTPDSGFTDEQIVTNVELITYYLHVYAGSILPNRGHILRHSDINSVDRSYCPGPKYPLADVIKAAGGDPVKLNP